MEWIADPTVWVGLATLVALEIVLGVDNLIFIAIVVDPHDRFQGIVTRTDLLEAIAGEFPDEGE